MDETWVDLSPAQALETLRTWNGPLSSEAQVILDRFLGSQTLRFLQDRSGSSGDLRALLLEAVLWAEREAASSLWVGRWQQLLELVRDAEGQPALPAELRALAVVDVPEVEGRAAELLAFLASDGGPVRPVDAEKSLKLSASHVGNLVARLESAGLLVRRRSATGKATWLVPTGRGFQMAALLPRPAARPEPRAPRPEARPAAPSPWRIAPFSPDRIR